MSVKSLEMAKNIRKISVAMVYKAHASHIGGALSRPIFWLYFIVMFLIMM